MRFCSRVLHVKGHACKHQCRVLKSQASLGQRLVPFCRVKGRPQRTHVVFRKAINSNSMYLAQPLRDAGLPNRALWQQKAP